MQYVLHKSWCDYTFSNHYCFFTGTLEQVSFKQQEYTSIFQEVLKSLVCQQVIASIQFFKLEKVPSSKAYALVK